MHEVVECHGIEQRFRDASRPHLLLEQPQHFVGDVQLHHLRHLFDFVHHTTVLVQGGLLVHLGADFLIEVLVLQLAIVVLLGCHLRLLEVLHPRLSERVYISSRLQCDGGALV